MCNFFTDAQFKHGIMQLSCLTELDLCDLPLVVHDKLQVYTTCINILLIIREG